MTDKAATDEKFVVVEDEAFIRLFVCEVLADAGFEVLGRGKSTRCSPISICRVQWTPRAGQPVLAELAPGALLIASGRPRPRSEEMPAGIRFLPKPYHPDHVAGHLREMIAPNRPHAYAAPAVP
jgi:hypothetical protein